MVISNGGSLGGRRDSDSEAKMYLLVPYNICLLNIDQFQKGYFRLLIPFLLFIKYRSRWLLQIDESKKYAIYHFIKKVSIEVFNPKKADKDTEISQRG